METRDIVYAVMGIAFSVIAHVCIKTGRKIQIVNFKRGKVIRRPL